MRERRSRINRNIYIKTHKESIKSNRNRESSSVSRHSFTEPPWKQLIPMMADDHDHCSIRNIRTCDGIKIHHSSVIIMTTINTICQDRICHNSSDIQIQNQIETLMVVVPVLPWTYRPTFHPRYNNIRKHSRFYTKSIDTFRFSSPLLFWMLVLIRICNCDPNMDGDQSPHGIVGVTAFTTSYNSHRYTTYNNDNVIVFPQKQTTRRLFLFLDTETEETSPMDDPHTTYQSVQHKSVTSLETILSSPTTSSSSTEGLSKFHRSILRHSGMSRQRFVTGRYPIVLSFRNNPTRKWLNLGTTLPSGGPTNGPHVDTKQHVMAETEVYVNGTIASQSLASLDRFYWYEDHERRILQQEYGMISMELLAEIHVDRPGYVNIMSSRGGGRRAAMSNKIRQQQIQHGNRWTIQAMNLLKSHNEGHTKLSNLASSAVVPSSRTIHNQDHPHSRFMEMIEGITSTTSSEQQDRLWVTGFALTGRQGSITAIDCEQCYIQPLNERSKSTMLWPNEVQEVPNNLLPQHNNTNIHAELSSSLSSQHQQTLEFDNQYQDAILVCDGFLVPTKDRGGIYVVKNPGHETEWTISLTKPGDRWFYHRAVWMDITGDGRQSILTARCQVSTVLDPRKNGDGMVTSGVTKSGQLLWLECPRPAMIDPISGTPLESDGTIFDPFSTRHLPWKEHVLSTGPDVMFAIADLDTSDDTIEVLASEFFNKQVTLTSIRCNVEPNVVFKKIIDDQSGQAFGCILANLDASGVVPNRSVVDAGSTVNCLQPGHDFSHVLVTSHECKYDENDETSNIEAKSTSNGYVKISSAPTSKTPEGGSLFAYRVPEGKDAWRTKPWERSVVASGFKVRDKLNNMINPGAPGFVYTFYANVNDAQEMLKRPLIAVAGDCAESAFIFRPSLENSTELASTDEIPTNYKLMAEIQCEATVGSIGIGYNDFSSVEQESGYAKLYIPCFESDKIMVFGLGSGEDDDERNSW